MNTTRRGFFGFFAGAAALMAAPVQAIRAHQAKNSIITPEQTGNNMTIYRNDRPIALISANDKIWLYKDGSFEIWRAS